MLRTVHHSWVIYNRCSKGVGRSPTETGIKLWTNKTRPVENKNLKSNFIIFEYYPFFEIFCFSNFHFQQEVTEGLCITVSSVSFVRSETQNEKKKNSSMYVYVYGYKYKQKWLTNVFIFLKKSMTNKETDRRVIKY